MTAQEGLDGDLVGGVESDAVELGCTGCFVCEAKARKAREVGWLEVEAAERGHVKGKVARDALGPGERVEDGKADVYKRQG